MFIDPLEASYLTRNRPPLNMCVALFAVLCRKARKIERYV